MLDTSKKPTLTEIAYKARHLATTAKTFAQFASNSTFVYNDYDRICDCIFIISEMASELEAMAGVADNLADFDYYLMEHCGSMKG